MRIETTLRIGAVLAVIALRPAGAGVLTPGDLLVDTSSGPGSTLSEYTTSGGFVQSFAIPAGPGVGNSGRDIIVDPLGNVQIYNGTFSPVLSTLDPATGVVTSQSGPAGWSTGGTIYSGGIATYQNYVFATDESTASPGTPNGIIRFNMTTGTSDRFGDTSGTLNPGRGNYLDLTVGGNGYVYALTPDGSPLGTSIDVFNPVTEALVRTISLMGNQSSGIAVTASGDIYSVQALTGVIQHFDANGNLVGSLATNLPSLQDIDLSNTGQLAVGGRFGDVVLTDTSLTSSARFTDGTNPTFVAFTSPLIPATVPVPEPASLGLLAAGAVGLLAVRRVGRRFRPNDALQ